MYVGLYPSAVYCQQDDYRQALDEYDQKVFHNFRVILQELRNTYVSLLCTELSC